MPNSTELKLGARWRIMRGEVIAIGPGKAQLLEGIAELGSLAKAARKMKMSYMRAWLLVQEMHRCFAQPLVQMERGGPSGGGAKLTESGQEVLALYRQIEAHSVAATEADWSQMRVLLRRK